MKKLLIGISGSSILHKDTEPEFSIEEIFRIVSESQVYDYIEKTPPNKENPTIESRKLLRIISKCLWVALDHQVSHA